MSKRPKKLLPIASNPSSTEWGMAVMGEALAAAREGNWVDVGRAVLLSFREQTGNNTFRAAALYLDKVAPNKKDDNAALAEARRMVANSVPRGEAIATVVAAAGGNESDKRRLRGKWTEGG